MSEPSNEPLSMVTTPAGSFFVCETPEEVAHAQATIMAAANEYADASATLVPLTLADPHPTPGQTVFLGAGMIGIVQPVNESDLTISRKAFKDADEAAGKVRRGEGEGDEKPGAGFR